MSPLRLTVALLCALALLPATTAAQEPPGAGTPAPQLQGTDLVSKQVARLSDYAGKWVLVDFWASWCGPCMDELPQLLAQTRKLRGDGRLALFSFSGDTPDTLPKLQDAIASLGIDYPVLYDGASLTSPEAVRWGIYGIPQTFLINPKGTIVATGLDSYTLLPTLEWHMTHPDAAPAMEESHVAAEDGTYTVTVRVTGCPDLPPADLNLWIVWEKFPVDPADPTLVTGETEVEVIDTYASTALEPNEKGAAAYRFMIRPEAEWDVFNYGIDVVPSSRLQPDAPDEFIPDLSVRSEIIYLVTLDDSSGQLRVTRN